MRNLATLKSAFAVALCVFTLSSCVEETLYRIDKEEVRIQNNLVLSKGQIVTGNDAINLVISLAQDCILVDDFTELTLASEEFVFSDSQEASISTDVEGTYQVENISFRDYEIEEYSTTKRRVTLNLAVKYSYNDGEKRDTVLSPWYFQETQTPPTITPQEPEVVEIVSYTPRHTIKNNNSGTVTATLFVDKLINDVVDTTYKAVITLAKVGSVSGMEIHTIGTSCTKENMQCDTLSIEEKIVKNDFLTTVETRLYRWETSFTSTTGGSITPKNEIKFILCSKVVFEIEGFKYTWSFNGNAYDVVRTIEDKGLEGKMIEGTYSPYLGTYVLKVNTYLFSPQVPELDGSEPFHSSTAENHLYQRESVV